MFEIIITKIILGLSLAAPIGPVNAEMIKRGLAVGFWGAFNVRIGGIIANILLLILAYFGLGSINQYPKVIFSISLLGVLALIYLGFKNIIRAFSSNNLNILKHKNANKINYSIANGLLVGFSLSFASPIGLMFWLSTFAASMQQDLNNTFDIKDLLINFFIILGVALWGIFISLILHFFSKIINEQKLRILTGLSGLILVYFGIKYGMLSFSKIT